jgi:acyl-CoA dehydrogenase
MAALIPQEYGGSGLSMAEASVIMEEINRSGGNSGACHGQMYVMNAIVRSRQRGAEAASTCRRSPAANAHPVDGRDRADHRQRHHQLKTTAVKKDGRWVINGQKVWISRIQHSDMMILLARTTPLAEVTEALGGLSASWST